MAVGKIDVTLTEVPQFRRLVRFLEEAEDYARLTADDDLMELVEDTRRDLQASSRGPR